ncbi:MAG TPA: response regulator, partial [Gammaproteobacteria bacterium]|nr:response regulator [Gammaproteobacteria bacterium]
SEAEYTVLIVDDESEMRELHKLFLMHGGFNVAEAENGKQAMQLLNEGEQQVDAILSDIVMPEMDGYEFCSAVKGQESTRDIPFIFISSLASLEEKSKGYSYGADDYIIKPLEAEELGLKIKNLIRRRESNSELSKQVIESRDAAMQIMNFYSDLGQILEFYKASVGVDSIEELADLLFGVTKGFGLHCSLQVHANSEVLNFGDEGEISPLEANVIELARQKERFYSFGSRLVINYEKFSFLVKNMPVENEERMGVLRDSLGVLCNAIEAKLGSLIAESLVAKKSEIAGIVQQVLQQTQVTFAVIEKENVNAIESLSGDIEESFLSLGLTEEQEENIRAVVEVCTQKVNVAFERGKALNAMFDEIRGKLGEIQGPAN